jgi:adenylate kinase
MAVILLGPPGVGKGTQGALLCDELGLEHVSTGDLLRAARREGTELGREAQAYMDRGELVPDEVIVGMVREALDALSNDRGVVFDGFPRTVPQAEALDGVLADVGRRVDHVVVLEADDEILVKRLSGRRSCPRCGALYNVHFSPPSREGVCDRCGAELEARADDAPDTVRNRLDVYHRQTEPLVRFYEEHAAPVHHIDGTGTVDAVQVALQSAVEAA